MNAYSSGQVHLLKATSEERACQGGFVWNFVSTYRLRAASNVSATLKKLLDNELVYHTVDDYMILRPL